MLERWEGGVAPCEYKPVVIRVRVIVVVGRVADCPDGTNLGSK